MKLFRMFSIVLLLTSFCHAQQWASFLSNADGICQASEGDYVWIGTENYLSKINARTGEVAALYHNFGTENHNVRSIAIDPKGNKWIVTDYAVAKFAGENWTVYSTENSPLMSSLVYSIAVDAKGNKWFGTNGGLTVFREEGVILDVKDNKAAMPKRFSLSQNYPNPFNPSTVIRYSLPYESRVKISVFNLLGQLVTGLTDEVETAGSHEKTFSAGNLPSGIYIYSISVQSTDGKNSFSSVKKMMILK